MHKVDLSNYELRTDLIIEKKIDNLINNSYQEGNIKVDDITISKNIDNKQKGKYITISYEDITDYNNYNNVLNVFIKELKKIFEYLKIKDTDKCLIIGLGNRHIISDALGSLTISNITVTRHLYLLNDVDKRYRNVSILEPSVIGMTGVDSIEIIKGVIKNIKPDFIICIDSLCAKNIERLNKTIQITTSGIKPGSGIGNNRFELSKNTLGVNVIAIGVPTVVDSAVIVSDTINYLYKKIGYFKNNQNNVKDKLKPLHKINYLKNNNDLEKEDREKLLGMIGNLNELELQHLIWEVLTPINANMIVTTKEIDFIITKLSNLIAEALNKSLHKI